MDEAQSADLKALKERELAELQRIASVARHWTLAQAAAWIVFRDISSVALFTPPRATGFITYLMYSDPDKKPVVHEQWHDLFRKLEARLLVATGRRSADGVREEIDAKHWVDLVPDVDAGPYVRLQSGEVARPWTDILVLHSDIERIWGRDANPNGRALYDRVWIQENFIKHVRNGKEREKAIAAVQVDYVAKYGRPEPSRPTIQRYVDGL